MGAIRLGRISYVNMAPVFYRLEHAVEEVTGVPTDLNARLVAGELDLAPISSIAWARNAERLRILPRLCVGSEGAVDSIQLVSHVPLEQVRRVAVTPESATSVVLTKVLIPEAEHVPLGEEADATLLIGDAALKQRVRGPDPPLRPRPALARAHGSADGLRGLRRARAGRRRAWPRSRTRSSPPCGERGPSPNSSPSRRASSTATRPASSPATSRSCATASARASAPGCFTFLEMARDVGELAEVPELRFVHEAVNV